jgi:hypothetical protein
VSAGSLPAGTSLGSSTGLVSGTPTTAGAFSYSIKVTESGGTPQTATQVVAGTIAPATLTLASTASATTQVGQAYSQTNVASGGTTAYGYTVSAGSLPAGTSLNASSGTVSGTPTTAGAFSYSIKVTDSGGTPQTATRVVSGTIAPATTTTTSLTSSVNPSLLGQSVTLTATVAPASATGTVTFKDGAATLGTGTLAGGTASLSTSALTLGAHTLTAAYGGDATFSASTSAPLTQTVNAGTLQVTPAADIVAAGNQGGPFSPLSFAYQISASTGTLE